MASAMAARPNVLLVVFDTARADGFDPYSPGRGTPAVAQLASRGVAYPKAIAPSCWTVPSHAAMFLGSPPRSVGLSNAPPGKGALCSPVIDKQLDRYLPEVFRRAGYATAGVSANLWISDKMGWSLGFDTFHDVAGERVSKLAKKGLRARLSWYLDALQARTDDGAQVVESLLKDWMGAAGRAPFFWFVNLIECHSPYLPPKPFNDYGPLARVRAAEDSRRYQTFEGVLRAAATGIAPPRSSLERMKHLYDRSLQLMDRWLARVLEALDGNGLLDDTVVIVTSDHGENFGENGLIGHGGSLDDRLLSVPLVVAGPNVPTAPDPVVSLNDLPRMIAGYAGMTDHPWGDSSAQGIAVAQYDGPVPPDHPRAGLLNEWGGTAEGILRLTRRFTAATDGTLKLVNDGDGDRLYDLTKDPLERASADAADYPAERIVPLQRAIGRALSEAWDPDVAGAPTVPEEDVADLEERMRLLGYL